MNEHEAADRLLALIREIESSALTVSVVAGEIWVADNVMLREPSLSDGIWEIGQ